MNADNTSSIEKTMQFARASILIGVHRRLKIFLEQVPGKLGDTRAPPMSNAMMWVRARARPEDNLPQTARVPNMPAVRDSGAHVNGVSTPGSAVPANAERGMLIIAIWPTRPDNDRSGSATFGCVWIEVAGPRLADRPRCEWMKHARSAPMRAAVSQHRNAWAETHAGGSRLGCVKMPGPTPGGPMTAKSARGFPPIRTYST